MHRSRFPVLFAFLGLATGLSALAEEPEAAPAAGARYLLGAVLQDGPDYAGADRRQIKLRPLWAYQNGRFRISTSRASSLLGFGGEASGPGASLDLLSSERFRLGVALRMDSGRYSNDSPRLAGLPDVKRTLRGKLYLGYAFDKHWSAGASVSQDLLGRRGGAVAGLDLGWRVRQGAETEWSLGTGVSFGDRRYMQSYFGIGEGVAEQTHQPAYRLGGMARDLHAGLGVTRSFGRHWLGFAGLGVSALLGDAAASPLTQDKTAVSGSLGLAYRWLP